MFRRVSIAVLTLCLFGQGCLTTPPGGMGVNPDPSGQPSPDGLIPYHNGFGALPGSPLSATSTGVVPMTFVANVPPLPEEVTVLREWAPDPDATIVRNVTGALRLPAGILGPNPVSEALTVRWRDDAGFRWSADLTDRSVSFVYEALSPIPVLRTGNAEIAERAASQFLTDHGIATADWGEPVARAYDVAFAQARDALPVVNADGTSVLAAAVATDASGQTVTLGRFELPSAGLERSNYPTLALDEVIARLKAGGTNPLRQSGTTITIDRIVFAYMPVPGDVNGAPRNYHMPVLWASGTAVRNGTTIPYGTLVPLVRDDAFTP